MLTLTILALLIQQSASRLTDNPSEKVFDKYLVTAEIKNTLTANQLKSSYPNLAYLIKNGYTAYKLTYNTTGVDGNPIIASGAVFIPDTEKTLPVLNYNHGTYFPSDERKAPSYHPAYNAEMQIGRLFAASGYLTVLPDYIGYGSTKHLQHPYGAYNILAISSIDMLRAVKEFCDQEKISLSGKNFISGWSEGAAVSLAVVKKLEELKIPGLIPTATVANAGPYYSTAFVDHILDSKKPLTYMSTYAWVLQSYNWVYNINKPHSYYFNEPAASRLSENLEAYVSHDPEVLFTDAFRKSYKSGKEKELMLALQQNDLWNWKPESKMILCHGDKDEYVPVFNSEKAFTEMKKKGADVELKVFKGHTHSSSAFNYLNQAFSTFESLR